MKKQSIWHLHLNMALVFHAFSAISLRGRLGQGVGGGGRDRDGRGGGGRAWLPESKWVQKTEVSIAPVTERTERPP